MPRDPDSNPIEVLALVPARGGSKGIPRKNLITVAGKPLIAHSIEQARSCAAISRVVVSTDDDEIANVATEFGAEVPFIRPAELARDVSRDLEVFAHALDWLATNEGYRPHLVVQLRPTEPVRTPDEIRDAIAQIRSRPEATGLKSVSRVRQTPYKMWQLHGDFLEPLLSLPGARDAHTLPRQQLPVVYWQNGIIDIVRPEVIAGGSMYGDRVIAYVMTTTVPPLDEVEDIPLVESALRSLDR